MQNQSAQAQHSPLKDSLLFLSASRIGTLEPSGTPSSCRPLSSAFCSSLFRFSSLLRCASVTLFSSIVARLLPGLAAPPLEFSPAASGREDLRPGSLSRRLSVCCQLLLEPFHLTTGLFLSMLKVHVLVRRQQMRLMLMGALFSLRADGSIAGGKQEVGSTPGRPVMYRRGQSHVLLSLLFVRS